MDIRLENHFTLWLARPMSAEGREWLETHTDGQWFGGALVIEPRFVDLVVDGAIGDGLCVE